MSNSPESERRREDVEQQAAAWVLRCDRRLTASEQDELLEWIAADPLHGECLARYRRHWNRVGIVAQWRPEFASQPNPDLLAPPEKTRARWAWPLAFAAAAALGAWFFTVQPIRTKGAPVGKEVAAINSISRQLLEDGSIVELNQGAEVTVHFTAGERRVQLLRGEAHFSVAKAAGRPFVVSARGVDVRAVGTSFNVRMEAKAIEVLVTEGRVQVDAIEDVRPARGLPAVSARADHLVSDLGPRQRAVVSLGAPLPVEIATLTRSEIDRVLAWQHRLLDFTASPLAEIVAELNQRNVEQLVIVDAELRSVRLSASIRSDNVSGFVNLLEAGFGVQAERAGDGRILLRRGSAPTR